MIQVSHTPATQCVNILIMQQLLQYYYQLAIALLWINSCVLIYSI